MRIRGKNGLALVLIVAGALILLSKIHIFGFMHHLFGLIFPIVILALGCLGIRRGRWLIGGILLFFGLMMLIGKLSGLLGLIVAIVMIGYGLSVIGGRGREHRRMHD